MGKLIDRDALIEAMVHVPLRQWNTKTFGEVLDSLPAVDAVPVVHAEWVEEHDRVEHFHCSACGVVWGVSAKAMKYCPGCGAKMNGEASNG